MNRPLEVVSAAVSAIRGRLLVVAGQSERTILLGTILVVSAVSVLRGFVLARYFSIDVLSALVLTVPRIAPWIGPCGSADTASATIRSW